MQETLAMYSTPRNNVFVELLIMQRVDPHGVGSLALPNVVTWAQTSKSALSVWQGTCGVPYEEKNVSQNEIEVISPLGLPGTQNTAIAPRLGSLEGKTVGEVYNHHFKGDQMFGLYRELLKQRYPGVRVVPYTELPASFVGGDTAYHRRVAREVAARAKEKGCDALITGNGG